jgi:hypothetical protein
MASEKFQIESYKVDIQQFDSAYSCLITLVSPDLSHGIRHRANVVFIPKNNFSPNVGAAANVGGQNFNGIQVAVWFSQNALATFYQVLSTEKPVYLQFDYKDAPGSPNGTNKIITSASLLTDSEFPGDHEKAMLIPFPNP